jgi:hypothetical protein
MRPLWLGHDELTADQRDRFSLEYAQVDESGIFDPLSAEGQRSVRHIATLTRADIAGNVAAMIAGRG